MQSEQAARAMLRTVTEPALEEILSSAEVVRSGQLGVGACGREHATRMTVRSGEVTVAGLTMGVVATAEEGGTRLSTRPRELSPPPIPQR